MGFEEPNSAWNNWFTEVQLWRFGRNCSRWTGFTSSLLVTNASRYRHRYCAFRLRSGGRKNRFENRALTIPRLELVADHRVTNVSLLDNLMGGLKGPLKKRTKTKKKQDKKEKNNKKQNKSKTNKQKQTKKHIWLASIVVLHWMKETAVQTVRLLSG